MRYMQIGDKLEQILFEIRQERARQDEKWGVQDHPDGTNQKAHGFLADFSKLIADAKHKAGELAFVDILLEETLEAASEEDPEKLRAELVQVAAVAVCWIEALDRRKAKAEMAPPSTQPAPKGYPA